LWQLKEYIECKQILKLSKLCGSEHLLYYLNWGKGSFNLLIILQFYLLIAKSIKNRNRTLQNKINKIILKIKNPYLTKKMMSHAYNSTIQTKTRNLKMKIKIMLYFKDKIHLQTAIRIKKIWAVLLDSKVKI